MKIKIAFVLWTLDGMGGSEKVVYDLARKLDKKVFEVVIIGFSDGPVKKLFQAIGAKVFSISKSKGLDLSFIGKLRTILDTEHIDVINVHHYGPFLYTSLASVGLDTSLIYTEHSRWQLEQLSLPHKVINRFLLIRTDALIAISKQIQDYYLHRLKLNKAKVHLIPNGIDLALYRPKANSSLRKDIGIGEDEKVVGIVANLRPEKNHKLLISAFSNVVSVLPNVRLVVAGDDCMDGQVQQFALESRVSERIHFLGRRDDIPELLELFDVFCLPSIHEGMPLTVLEAMSAGVPVVGADVLGINEVITNNANGFLFPSNDSNKLSEVIVQLLTDHNLKKRLSEAASQYVADHYDLDKKVMEYERLFHTVYDNSLL